MCSDQHVKDRMPRGFPLTSSLLLDYHVKQYTHAHTHAQLAKIHTKHGMEAQTLKHLAVHVRYSMT